MKETYADPWNEYAERYDKLYWAPGKPSNNEKKHFFELIGKHLELNSVQDPKILILGATPAFRDIAAKFSDNITLIDLSIEMYNEMTKLITHNKHEEFVLGSWLEMPFENNYFDLVLGDLVLGNVDAKNKNKFLSEIHRVLKPQGAFIQRLFFMPDDWKFESTEEVLIKFENMNHNYDKNTELFCYLLYNTFNEKTHEVYASKIKESLLRFWKDGKYYYCNRQIEELMNKAYEMWKPFKKVWHTGTKKEVFGWISKHFKILEERNANDHIFGKSYIIIYCTAI